MQRRQAARPEALVRENGSFEPFIYECDLFTKTG
eukprot:COSAG06_NODE_55601_length_288_cov_15.941799_1_plen_33_part_01